MYHYYSCKGINLASSELLPDCFGPETAPLDGAPLYVLVHGDPVLGRASFRVTHPGQLANPHGLEVLDASRLSETELDAPVAAALARGQLTAVNMDRPNWEEVLTWAPTTKKKRVNILAIGDVGSTLLTGLKRRDRVHWYLRSV